MANLPPTSPAHHGLQDAELSMRALIRRHRLVAVGALGGLLLILALLVAVVLAPRNGAVVNSTSCTQWSSSSQNQQRSFAARYVREYGNVANQAAGVTGVEDAVNAGCMAAFSSDEEDTVSVLDAIEGRY
jgi:hypothetical protein